MERWSNRSKKKKKNCRSLHRQRQRMRIIRQSKRWKSGLLRQAVRWNLRMKRPWKRSEVILMRWQRSGRRWLSIIILSLHRKWIWRSWKKIPPSQKPSASELQHLARSPLKVKRRWRHCEKITLHWQPHRIIWSEIMSCLHRQKINWQISNTTEARQSQLLKK